MIDNIIISLEREAVVKKEPIKLETETSKGPLKEDVENPKYR